MRLTAALSLAMAATALVALWLGGGLDGLAREALAAQRALSAHLAGGIAAIRAGEPGALAALMLAAGAYGLAHAAGPGHGKALLGAAAAGSRAAPSQLVGLALAGSLAQGVSAVVVVVVGVGLFDLGMTSLVTASDAAMARAGLWMLGAVGLWLVWRGLRAARRRACCHGHGAPATTDALGWRASAALVLGVALRPCGGAMLVLAVAWSAAVPWAGVLAVLAMALGTAVVTSATALAACGAREAALVAGGVQRLAPVAAGLQLAAGLGALGVAIAGLAG